MSPSCVCIPASLMCLHGMFLHLCVQGVKVSICMCACVCASYACVGVTNSISGCLGSVYGTKLQVPPYFFSRMEPGLGNEAAVAFFVYIYTQLHISLNITAV